MVKQLGAASSQPNEASRSLLRRVLKEVDTLPIELAMVADDTRRRTLIRDALQDHLSNRVSNHGASAIATTLQRMGAEFDGLWAEVDTRADLWPGLHRSGGPRGSAAILDEWTRKRHRIVHGGEAVRVLGPQVRQLIDLIDAIGTAVDARALQIVQQL